MLTARRKWERENISAQRDTVYRKGKKSIKSVKMTASPIGTAEERGKEQHAMGIRSVI
jgi:hypothetical protein